MYKLNRMFSSQTSECFSCVTAVSGQVPLGGLGLVPCTGAEAAEGQQEVLGSPCPPRAVSLSPSPPWSRIPSPPGSALRAPKGSPCLDLSTHSSPSLPHVEEPRNGSALPSLGRSSFIHWSSPGDPRLWAVISLSTLPLWGKTFL